jgi:sortase (surface protein transpeptidase)
VDARRTPFRSRRALTILIVAALLAGGALAVAGVVTRGGGDEVVLEVEPVVALSVPSTVAPRPGPERNAPKPDTPNATVQAMIQSAAPRPLPVKLEIDVIDVARFPVRQVGLEPDGQMEVPDETEIGWYRYGAAPGEEGATVLAAHVSWNRTSGPFAQLGRVEPGAKVALTLDDGTVRHYEVIERAVYGKLGLPGDRLWRRTGPEELVLITCGGEYNSRTRRYAENIVVYAVPVGDVTGTSPGAENPDLF